MASNDISFVFKVDTNAAKASMEKFLQDAKQKAAEGISVSLKTGDATTAKGLVSGLASGFDAQKQAAIESFEAQKKALATMTLAGKSGSKEFDAAKKQLLEAKKAAEQFDNALAEIDPAPASKSAGGLLGALSSINPAALAAGGGLTYMATAAVKMDEATAKIRTLGGAAKELAPDLQTMSLEMSKSMPISPVELQTAAYDALSAGIKATKEDMSAFVEASGKLAIGGGETVGGAVNLLSSMVNAYGESAQKAGEYSDTLFTTVNLGKTTIPELNASLSNVIPTAVQAGVNLKGVGASLALMTANGIPTAQATTKLNQLFTELMKPGKELEPILKKAGVSIASLKNESLPANLGRIQKELAKTGTAAVQAFSSGEAAGAFATLTKDIGTFEDYLSQFDNGAGATQAAFEEMSKSVGVQFDQLKAQAEAFGIEIAGNILPVISGVAGAAAPVLGYVFGLIQSSLPLITAATGVWGAWKAVTMLQNTALYAELVATKATTGAISLKTIATTVATKAVNAMKAAWATNPLGVAILGIMAAVAAFKYLSDVMTVTSQEKLEAAEAEGKYLVEQKKSVEKDKEQVKSKKALVDEYIRLGSKTKMTAKESADYKRIQGEIQSKYPGLIKNTSDFGASLGDLKKFSEDSVKQLAKLDGKLSDLDKQILKNMGSMADARAQVAVDTMWDALQSAQGSFSRFFNFLGNGIGISSEWDNLRNQLNKANNDLWLAANTSEEAIRLKTNAMKTLVNNSSLFEDSKMQKDKVSMQSAIGEIESYMLKRYQAYHTTVQQMQQASTPPPTPTDPGDTKKDTDKAKKDAEEREKARVAVVKEWLDNEKNTIERFYQSIEDIRNSKGEIMPGFPILKADDENNVNDLQQKFRELGDVASIAAARLGDLKLNTKGAKEAAADLMKNITGEVGDFRSKLIEQIGKEPEVYLKGAITFTEYKIQEITRIIDKPASRDEYYKGLDDLEAELKKKAGFLKQQVSFIPELADQQKIYEEIANLQSQINDVVLKRSQSKRKDELAGIKDLAEYEKELSLDAAKETLAIELAMAGENVKEQEKAWRNFIAAKKQIDEDYAQNTEKFWVRTQKAVESAMAAMGQSLLDLDVSPWADKVEKLEQKLSDLRKKSTEEEKNSHESETKSLVESLRKKEIAQQDYFKRMNELSDKETTDEKKDDEAKLKWKLSQIKMFEALQAGSQISATKYAGEAWDTVQKNADAGATTLGALFKDTAGNFTKFASSAVSSSIASFGAMLSAGMKVGEAFRKGMLVNLITTAEQAILTYIPQIYAASMAWLGPVVGAAAATVAIPGIYAMLEVAKANLGRKKGEVDIDGPGTETSDDVPRMLSRHESVITAKGTKASGNKELFQWINDTGGSAADYFDYKIQKSAARIFQEQFISLNLEQNLTNAAIQNAMKHIDVEAPKRTVADIRRKLSESAALDRRVQTVVNNVTNYYNSIDTKRLENGMNNLGKKVDEFTKAINEKGYLKESKVINQLSIDTNESKLFSVSEKKRVHEVGRR